MIPLLFVQEGMDITTLVRWESSLGGAPERVVTAPAAKPEKGPTSQVRRAGYAAHGRRKTSTGT